MDTPFANDDLMNVDDMLMGYEDSVSATHTLTLKIAAASNDQDLRDNMEPLFSDAIRSLRDASNEEARLMAAWDEDGA